MRSKYVHLPPIPSERAPGPQQPKEPAIPTLVTTAVVRVYRKKTSAVGVYAVEFRAVPSHPVRREGWLSEGAQSRPNAS